MYVRVGSWALKNWCFWTVLLEKTLESSLDCKEIQPVHSKGNQSWIFIGRTDVEAETPILWPLATWCKLTHWKRPWCWENLKPEGKGDNRGQDGWMISLTRWTWVWARAGNWWWTGKPGVLQSMGLQRVRHDWVTELMTDDDESSIIEECEVQKSIVITRLSLLRSNIKILASPTQAPLMIIIQYHSGLSCTLKLPLSWQ